MLSYLKCFDNNTGTQFIFSRPNNGIAGINLGAGNAAYVAKIRYFIHSSEAANLSKYIGHTFVGCVETPELVTVLTEVSTSAGQVAHYNYDIHTDTSIDQDHLVLTEVDYFQDNNNDGVDDCLLYTSPSPRDKRQSRMPSSA